MAEIVFTSKLADIEEAIKDVAFAEILPQVINAAKDSIQTAIIPEVIEAIRNTETWDAIRGVFKGDPQRDLQAVLGIANPEPVLEDILSIIQSNIRVDVLQSSNEFGYIITLLTNESYQNMIAGAIGSYVSEPSGETIPWLRWLLLGSSDLIVGYALAFEGSSIKSFSKSRTGRAIMRKTKSGRWSIEDHVSGNEENNFLFEALDSPKTLGVIQGIIIRELEKVS